MSSRIQRALLLCVALCFFTIYLLGQGRASGGGTILYVRVVHNDERAGTQQLRVELITSSGLLVFDGFTDSLGMTSFPAIRAGSYRLRVSGQNVVETTSAVFNVDGRPQSSQTEIVTVQSAAAESAAGPVADPVAVVDLNVPKRAQKEFEKGAEAFKRSDMEQARGQF